MYKEKCGLELLKRQFEGMCCGVSLNTHTHNNNLMVTFCYESFDCDIGKFKLCLFDSNDETLHTILDNDIIIEVNHLSDDIYKDVISIHTKDFILSVTTLESKSLHEV
jgi:hypothetical protein